MYGRVILMKLSTDNVTVELCKHSGAISIKHKSGAVIKIYGENSIGLKAVMCGHTKTVETNMEDLAFLVTAKA